MKLGIRVTIDLILEAPELPQPVNFDDAEGQIKQFLDYSRAMDLFVENTGNTIADWQYKIEEIPLPRTPPSAATPAS